MSRTIVLDSVSYTLPDHGDTNYDQGANQLNAYLDALTTASNSRKAEILLKLDKAGLVSAPSGTTTLTSTSARLQILSPTTAITLNLPSGSIVAGDQFWIVNTTAYAITIKASGGSTKDTLYNGTIKYAAAINTPTAPADWYKLETSVPVVTVMKTYETDVAYTNGTPTIGVTAANPVKTIGLLIPYQTIDGQWWIRGVLKYAHDSVANNNLTISGCTPVGAGNFMGMTAVNSKPQSTYVYSDAGTFTCVVDFVAAAPETSVQFDVPITAKPTWAD